MIPYLKRMSEFIFSWILPHKVNNHENSKQINASLCKFAKLPAAEALQILNTSERGLSQEEVNARIEKYGLNEIAHEKPPSWYVLLLKNFTNPFIAVLIILATVSYFIGEMDAVIIIGVMVAISVIMRFSQEYRSNKAAEKLKALVSTKATVLRHIENEEPKKQELEIKYLVPGDIIYLSAGDMLPGDVRLISAKDVYVSQSALTGESLPIEKDESFKAKDVDNPLEMPNMCYMGSNVLNGTAMAVIVATGNQTFFGSMAKTLTGYRPLTSFDIGVNKVSWLLIRFMLVMVPFVFLINGFTKGDWFEALLFSLSVAVGLTPEMLPMIVTANLARGALNMSRSKVVVKRLNAIQNFGAMDILCTDKTGTLTQDKVILDRYLNIEGKEDETVLNYAYLNSFYQTGLKNLLDIAVLEHSEAQQALHLDKEYRKVDEIPFDFTRRRMSVIVEKTPQQHILICKGAVEEIFGICSQLKMNGSVGPFTDEIKERVNRLKTELNEDGLRVLAVAYKEIEGQNRREYRPQDENNLVLMGLLAFLDPPKQSVAKAIINLHKYNVEVKILTGDNELVTQKICKWVNLKVNGALNGSQIDKMSDEELAAVVEKTTIFAKLSPQQKARIIASLKSKGHTVGYLGDGINDAAALREADIGISVDTAVDIAKESADIIMLEKNLLFLGEGVIEGRKTFANIIKYIKMAVSSNFGNVFSVVGASVILPFLPMLPIQILVQNLLYDLSQTTIPFDNVDKEYLLKPRKWNPRGIAKFMIFIGPISSIFDYTTFAIMWFYFGANTIGMQSLFQSGWFVEGLLSQTLIVHMIRTEKIPFIQSMASMPLLLTTFIIMAIGIYIPYTYLGASIGLTPLPSSYFHWLFVTLLAYCVLVQIVKKWFIKKYNYWL
jgi:P-type Mg2+ transporter